ncbi:MAG: lysylphosphatidylglycerol synthase transmembrane domain-containing protein [Actinomycetota bacterium]|nr:lysylphosphatidylglycerol synthase transmembrane domain-containing protein [Actinomycetota bacterium]
MLTRTTPWRSAKLAIFLVASWFLAVPQIPVAARALTQLADIPLRALLLGAICSSAALVAYGQLTRTLLDDGPRPTLRHTLGIVITSLGVNRVLPAGGAAGTVATYRLLNRAGVRRRRAAFTLTMQGILSAFVLNALLWIALLVTLPARGFAPEHLTAVLGGLIVLGFAVTALEALYHGRHWLRSCSASAARILPKTEPESLIRLLDDQSARLRRLTARIGTLSRATAWSALNWLLDAAALWIFLWAFGASPGPVAVLAAFAVANVAALVPITPGGLGVVELALTAVLVGFGAPADSVILGVAAYRVFNYWLPIPASPVAYLALRYAQAGQPSSRADALDVEPAPTHAPMVAVGR